MCLKANEEAWTEYMYLLVGCCESFISHVTDGKVGESIISRVTDGKCVRVEQKNRRHLLVNQTNTLWCKFHSNF